MGSDVHSWRRWLSAPRLDKAGGAISRSVDREENTLSPELDHLRKQLRGMPRLRPSERESLQLRILASKARVRALRYKDWPSTFRYLLARFTLHNDNLMKPIAVPAVGGLVAALVLFLLLAPVYPVRTVNAASLDVPTRLSTSASVKTMASFTSVERPVNVLVQVNNEGRVVGYLIEESDDALLNEAVRRQIEQILLFTVFTPATNFGLPCAGEVRISVDSNVVLVQG
ncbi:MAG: hypothetical protein U5J83_08620 [Bryobacterales bacterium]|nr:hypothetical protein [Bryobacterales bacterium]